MKITIDNLQGLGPQDYTQALDGTVAPTIVRRINQPAQLKCILLGSGPGFVIPVACARVIVAKANGSLLFTGYLTQVPRFEYLGYGERGAVYRYEVIAESDEFLLDQKALPNRAPFVARSAGSALRQLAQDLMPGEFDTSAVENVDVIATYKVNPQKTFSYHAGEIALAARGSYRAMNGALMLTPVGTMTYVIDESDVNFSPAGLKLASPKMPANDVTVIGLIEPQAYVRDYFVGDGLSLHFYLSQTPFQQSWAALIDEGYVGSGLDPATWTVSDPALAISVAQQALRVNGGTGQDGATSVAFVEQIELAGALELQHGDVSFSGPSQGVIGGLYWGTIGVTECLAGFRVTPSDAGSNIQAVINGAATGPVVATTAGHRYALTTYLYSMEVYRAQETYHSSLRVAGSGRGGASVAANVRVVLELQDIDPANPASKIGPATVLFDDVIANAPAFCTYALVNASNLQCSIAYTYAAHISLAMVRTALPDSPYSTQLVESLSDGGQCRIAGSTTLDFYPQYVPALNTLIVASYRGSGRAVAEIANSAGIAGLAKGNDDGVRSLVRTMKSPTARTQVDCENAALAILDDAGGAAWEGSYETWSDFLPGGADDIFPGDGVAVNVPSQNAGFSAIVRTVNIQLEDPAGDRGIYTIEFANDWASPLAMQAEEGAVTIPLHALPPRLSTEQAGTYYLASLTDAQVTSISSTTVEFDVGLAPANGLGVEVRMHDYGWGPGNDRNLVGRYNTQTFSVPRLARTQNYFLRLYDASSPPRYSRYASALHVDYPL